MAVPARVTDSLVSRFVAARRAAGLTAWRRTQQAAQAFWARMQRAGGWAALSPAQQLAASRQAPVFAAWLMVTGQLTVKADVLSRMNLQLGMAARHACPAAYRWFVTAADRLGSRPTNTARQWAALARITACTGTAPDAIGPAEFTRARPAIVEAFGRRPSPNAGRSIGAAFYQLQLTLFHAGRLGPSPVPSARVRVGAGGPRSRRRHRERPPLHRPGRPESRPSTVAHIEHDRREIGTCSLRTIRRSQAAPI